MPDGNLNGSKIGASIYQGCCDVYGGRKGFSAEKKWQKQEQKYEGTFVGGAFHGEGAYEWFTSRERLVFEGQFYSNFKEGYGVVSLPDGSVFEGLFSNNRPLGPGIKTHVNGRQDVGFWCGNRIVRLSRSVDCIIPRLASTFAGKLKLLQFRRIMQFAEKDADMGAALLMKHGLDPSYSSRLYSHLVHDPRSMFFDRPHMDGVCFAKIEEFDSNAEFFEGNVPSRVSYPGDDLSWKRPPPSLEGGKLQNARPEVREGKSPVDSLWFEVTKGKPNASSNTRQGNAAVNIDAKATTKLYVIGDAGIECGVRSAETQLLSWNRNELCMEMLKQIFRFRFFEERLTFKISDLMAGTRTKFRKTGETERLNLHFLKMCSIGPAYIIKELLCSKSISEALMDSRGNNSVMFAAAADKHDVIELLLNYGADVNSFNDENLTPLNFCLLRRIAQGASLGNWELSFLVPDASSRPGAEAVKAKTWRGVESIASLDRIFGDGMSAFDIETPHEIGEFPEEDSVFFFDDDDESQDRSSVTVLRYKANEESRGSVSGTRISQATGNGDEAVQVRKGVCPTSFKREEYLRSIAEPTGEDKYFFELSVGKCRQEGVTEAGGVPETVRSEAFDESSEKHFTDFNERVFNINKTIEQLLRRGADPNLADAPKPSLHLAVYSGEPNLVRLLLSYGAAPDSHTLPQEGLLTPLHVLVLMKPGKERVAMCQLLLNYGASPEEETAPNFTPNGERDFPLDPEHGRTPLQLLCTRQGAEDIDPDGFLCRLALLLVEVSAVGHFFRGHSYLTLAMISGNYALVEALLTSKRVDPNEVLGGDLGTALHVLVSAELQKQTLFENSIRMCDLLLERGANPNLRFRTPHQLAGTCIDYGYREIERERDARQESNPPGNDPAQRYYLEDHLKVVEYLDKRKKHGNGKGRNQSGKQRLTIVDDEKKGRMSTSVKANVKEYGGDASGEITIQSEKDEREGENIRRSGRNKILGDERGDGADEAGNKTKIVEIKKQVEKAATRKQDGEKSPAGKGSKKKVDRAGKVGSKRDGMAGRASLGEGSKDKKNAKQAEASGSERLPERFCHSLLHMFGICGERLDLNDFLLPYVVLRNGDLYYRFKGRKPAGTEQYSLI